MSDELNQFMKPESTLPADFNGVFNFTNPSDEEFVGIWGKKEYHFPARSTSPMVIPEHSPIEIQHIRKKFARDLAEREFFKGNRYEHLRKQEGEKAGGVVQARLNSIHQAASYTDTDLLDLIQLCLKPLPVAQAVVAPVQAQPIEEKLSRNDDGELNTRPVDKNKSLRARALEGSGLPA